MRALVTGSAGHLGEALARSLRGAGREVVGLDVLASAYTTHVGSITDRACVRAAMAGVSTVFHAATLHKPHVATHGRQDFIDTNITGTLNLLEEATAAGVRAFVFTSTTSVFGDALTPPPGAARRVDHRGGRPRPQEHLRGHQGGGGGPLPALPSQPAAGLPRAQDLAVLSRGGRRPRRARRLVGRQSQGERIPAPARRHRGRGRAPICWPPSGRRRSASASTSSAPPRPSSRDDCADLRDRRRRRWCAGASPGYEAEYARRGWRMFPSIGRVYVNDRARRELGWRPRHDFPSIIERLTAAARPERPRSRDRRQGLPRRGLRQGPYPVG